MAIDTADLIAIFERVSMDVVGDRNPVHIVRAGSPAAQTSWVEFALANENVLRGFLDDSEINLVLLTPDDVELSRVRMTYCEPELIEEIVDHFATFSASRN